MTGCWKERRIQNPVKHLRLSFQPLTIFVKGFILDVLHGSKYTSRECQTRLLGASLEVGLSDEVVKRISP